LNEARVILEKMEHDLREEKKIWFKEVRKIGTKLADINIWLCCGRKKVFGNII
jgi:hypothetical protein